MWDFQCKLFRYSWFSDSDRYLYFAVRMPEPVVQDGSFPQKVWPDAVVFFKNPFTVSTCKTSDSSRVSPNHKIRRCDRAGQIMNNIDKLVSFSHQSIGCSAVSFPHNRGSRTLPTTFVSSFQTQMCMSNILILIKHFVLRRGMCQHPVDSTWFTWPIMAMLFLLSGRIHHWIYIAFFIASYCFWQPGFPLAPVFLRPLGGSKVHWAKVSGLLRIFVGRLQCQVLLYYNLSFHSISCHFMFLGQRFRSGYWMSNIPSLP